MLWKPPVYQGRDPVNGFYVDIKEAEASEEEWRGVNNKATEKTYFKVFIWESTYVRFVFISCCRVLIRLNSCICRLRILKKERRMCSACVLRIKPVLEKPPM